jgi:predicted transcriptional regulator
MTTTAKRKPKALASAEARAISEVKQLRLSPKIDDRLRYIAYVERRPAGTIMRELVEAGVKAWKAPEKEV